ncbi:hypothetical protein QR680_002689 [Steinernema hermaphroditum]|uniref:5'-nucleotidase domain-containing protein 3 n=1 Tax=Steinernema hermaphroditum TaxID=289476 RepID=A0AA39LIR6_9BILA|nr:hypothetical protein QR680_002689 [Steinernema hermaphroditum]
MPFLSRTLYCCKRVVSAQALRSAYKKAQELASLNRPSPPPRIDPRGVFANNELNLHKIGVYGFDYDYTLAVYTRELSPLIYNLAINRLVTRLKYPEGLLKIPYDPTFAIRGLHYDIDHSCLLKVDAFNQIQKGTVYRGRKKLTDDEVMNVYGGFTLPDEKGRNLPQLIDLFSLPWAGLLATVVQYFDDNNISFDPVCLYQDVAEAVRQVHVTGEIISRSTARFMNIGMCYMLGEDWRRLFKYIVVSAKKPNFFQGKAPFRLYLEKEDSLWYERVTDLEPGRIYSGGNITDFSKKARFKNDGVLYFGDHIYTDLADPMLQLGWHTAAIVPELAREIRAQNHEQFRVAITWLELLTSLIEAYQCAEPADDEGRAEFRKWILERRMLRQKTKAMFNPQFGSMFRTYHNMTYFSRRLGRLSDIYTSRLPNMLKYSDEHTFFPRRNALPHETHLHIMHVQAPIDDDDVLLEAES